MGRLIPGIMRSLTDEALADAARGLSDDDLASMVRRSYGPLCKELLERVLGESLRGGAIDVDDDDESDVRGRD